VPGAEAYHLELQGDGDAALADTVTAPTWTSPPLPAGSWTLVATAVAQGASSEPTRVAFVRTQAPPLAAPVATTPDDATRIVFWAAPPPVTLGWQAVSDAAGYQVELDAPEVVAAAAPPSVAPLRVAGLGHELAGMAPGAHRWRVRAVDADGEPGPWSTSRTLWLAPAQGAVAALTVDPAPVPVGLATPAHVRLEVRDADGAPVTGELRAQALHGSLGALTAVGAGVFVGEYVAPSEGRLEFDELALERAGEPAVPAARLPLLPAVRLRAGVSAGAVANFAAPIAPQVALEADYKLARVLGGLGATVRVGYHQKQLSTSGALAASAVQHSVPLMVGGRLALLHGPVVPYAGAGVLAALFVSTVRVEGQAEDERSVWGLGLEATAGCELARLGPGSVFGEARWAWLRARAREVAYDGGGLAIAVGYRLDLW